MKYILLAFQLFPAILSAVKAAEQHVEFSGAGKQKLDMVTGVAEAVFEEAKDDVKDLDRNKVIGLIVRIVGRVVSVLNGLGIFQKA